MFDSILKALHYLNINSIADFSLFLTINIIAWYLGIELSSVFIKHSKIFKNHQQKVKLHHVESFNSTSELLETTSKIQERIDFAKKHFQYLSLDEQADIKLCQVQLDNYRGEILKQVIGKINL